MVDKIDERNAKERIARSIIKRSNIHFLSQSELDARTQKEAEEQERLEEEKRANEIIERLNAEAAADEAKKQEEIALALKEREAAYNPATKAHSGLYGKEEVYDAATKEQINQILTEKEKDFDETLEELKNQTQIE